MEDNKNKEDYGHVTVGAGGREQRKIKVINYIRCTYIDNRFVSVSELENSEGFILAVENLKSSDRSTQQSMWLSKESFIGLLSASTIYINAKEWNMDDLIKESVKGKEIAVSVSDNLKLPFAKDETDKTK